MSGVGRAAVVGRAEAAVEMRDLPLDELIARRWRAGRRARGLDQRAPFRWDRPEAIGFDELEELVDAAIYRRERYRAWYGDDVAHWPAVAWDRLQHARGEIESLRAELRLGPLSKREPRAVNGNVGRMRT